MLIAFAVAATPQEGVRGDRTVTQEFEANSQVLKKPGIHFSGSWVFSTIHSSVKSSDSELGAEIKVNKANFDAIRGILLWKVGEASALNDRSDAVRIAGTDIALSCLKQDVELKLIREVFSQEVGDSLVVVQGMPRATFDLIEVKSENVVSCIAARAEAGPISVPEAMVLLELCSEDSLPKARSFALNALSDVYGIGIELTVRGVWMASEKTLPAQALELWCISVRRDVAMGKDLSIVTAPMDAKLDGLNIEERLAFLGHRMHDSNVRASVVASLVRDGWLRTAELFSGKMLPLATVADHSGSKLPLELRGKIASTPIVTLLLLSGGQAPGQLSDNVESKLLIEARAAFNRIELPELIRAATLLQEAIALHPDQESMTLLGATLLALDDPSLARLVCRAAFKNNPAHPFAGVNLLLALRSLDMKDEARMVLDQVRRDASVNLTKWGNVQIALIAEWLEPKPVGEVVTP